ncbi:MAG: fibrobacter succinogenes major paralogous domain-containing protein [Candidatus Symbiothrix sp.]|nr:fibrobacter succinogenes major paralogous domain-containing protein [Candidatus Symbiothrix sp.]
MKKRILFRGLRIQSAMTVALAVACVLVTGNCSLATAQVAIGGDGTVTPGALLDLSQATDAGGLLLPQIVSADTATAVLRKPGMLVYNKTDGKIYAYNGSAWSAGGGSGGGGGSEPEPTPSPTSCSGSVMGLSGTVYPIGSYPYAQNDLKNLCWTLTNLREAGQSYTSYTGKTEDRGYYYGPDVATTAISNVCTKNIGGNWRVPTEDDWRLLTTGLADLTYDEREAWVGAPSGLAGAYFARSGCTYTPTWVDWDIASVWRVASTTGRTVRLDTNLIATYSNSASGGVQAECGKINTYYYQSIRCVRDL